MQEAALYSFGPFVLDAAQRLLRRGGEALRLTPREVEVLIALVERHGELVEKSRFFDQVWHGLAVEECNLSQHVAALRRVLHDDARVPTYIETVPRRGYRFVAQVGRIAASSLPPLAPRPAATPVPGATPVVAMAPAPEPSVHDPVPGASPTPLPVAAERREPAPPGRDESTPGAEASRPEVDPALPARRARHRAVAVASATLALLLALGVGAVWKLLRRDPRSRPLAGRSVVVQPFVNLTGDVHHDALAETLTRELMKDLQTLEGLRLEAGSVPATEREAARADWVVETSLLGGEGRIRLTAELIDASTRRLLWAEVFEATPVSFLEAEDRVAGALAAQLAEAFDRKTADASSGRADAQRECALAQEFLDRRTPQVVREALAHFTSAAERDPGYAPAHAGVAAAYLLGVEQRVFPPDDALARAEAAARRALSIDPEAAVAHAALGEIAAARWDFDAADASYRRALGVDPSIATIHEKYAALLTVRDRHEEAVAEARVARDLSPTCPAAATTLAAAYYHSGQNDAAIEQAHEALRLTPGFAAAYDVLGWAHQAKGDAAEAVAAFQQAVRLSGRSPTYVAALARAHARAGSRDEARTLLADLERQARAHRASPLDLAEVLAALGETDRALKQVERAVAGGAPWLQHVDAGLSLAALHDHARFRALVERMRRAGALPEPQAGATTPAAAERRRRPARSRLPGAAALAGATP